MLTSANRLMRQARAQFSCNFLACAKAGVIDNLGFASVEEGVKALKASTLWLSVPAMIYAAMQFLPPGCVGRYVYRSRCAGCYGRSGERENFIHVRCNVLETLKEYNEKLGVK